MMTGDDMPSVPASGSPRSGTAQTDTHLSAERREAARVLMMRPILTSVTNPEETALVRRHATALKRQFQTQLGYPLVVETGFARLVKQPLPLDAPARGASRAKKDELLTPRAYTCLALLCAGLLAPGTGEQSVISSIVEQLRRDAASIGITIEESPADVRAIVVALTHLVEWGLITETEGTVAAWGERKDEALLTVHRPLLAHLLARPLANLERPELLWEPDPDAPVQPRRDLRRKVAENPVVRRESLTDAEADALSRERRDIAHALDDLLGLTLEVRAEGVLAYDEGEELSDLKFPGQHTTRQAALLLIDAAIDSARPTAETTATLHGREVPGLFVSWPSVRDELEQLANRNVRAWRTDAQDVDGLQRSVVELLTGVGLVQETDEGIVLHPACARYRPVPEHSPRRPHADSTTRGAHDADGGAAQDQGMFTLLPERPTFDQDV